VQRDNARNVVVLLFLLIIEYNAQRATPFSDFFEKGLFCGTRGTLPPLSFFFTVGEPFYKLAALAALITVKACCECRGWRLKKCFY